MRMDRTIETLLSVGLIGGAGYIAYAKVPAVRSFIDSLFTKAVDPGSDKDANVVSGGCTGASCDPEKYNEYLEDDSDAGTQRIVQEALKDGLSLAGIGGLLANATKPVTATSMYLDQKTTVPTRTNQPYGSLTRPSGPAGATLSTTWIR